MKKEKINGCRCHKYCPYLDGTLSLYCERCGDVVDPANQQKKLLEDGPDIREDSSEEDVNRNENNAPQDKERPQTLEEMVDDPDLMREIVEAFQNQKTPNNIPYDEPESDNLGENYGL